MSRSRKQLDANQQQLLDAATDLAASARVATAKSNVARFDRDKAIRAAMSAGVPELHVAAATALKRATIYKIRNSQTPTLASEEGS